VRTPKSQQSYDAIEGLSVIDMLDLAVVVGRITAAVGGTVTRKCSEFPVDVKADFSLTCVYRGSVVKIVQPVTHFCTTQMDAPTQKH